MPRYSGRAPGHVRNAFQDAIDAFFEWNSGEAEPRVEFADREIKISAVCSLVWNCTDILPMHCRNTLGYCDIEPRARTYAAAARALKLRVKEELELDDISKPVPIHGGTTSSGCPHGDG
ncbi:BRA0787 family protein [Hyphomicrobium album]